MEHDRPLVVVLVLVVGQRLIFQIYLKLSLVGQVEAVPLEVAALEVKQEVGEVEMDLVQEMI